MYQVSRIVSPGDHNYFRKVVVHGDVVESSTALTMSLPSVRNRIGFSGHEEFMLLPKGRNRIIISTVEHKTDSLRRLLPNGRNQITS